MIQARLEEVDLVQRLPAYREYMEEVPRLIPRLGEEATMNTLSLFIVQEWST
jgi:hypothetical protein